MKASIKVGAVNQVEITEFDYRAATESEVFSLKELVYKNKIAILKNQNLTPSEYVEFSRRIGTPEPYYQPMYHHPDQKEIFVSSNVPKDGKQIGVPKTGKFWHADYAFMKNPFAFTLIYPQVVPTRSRGTYFIDMGEVYKSLPEALRQKLIGATCVHSVRKYFKIRPTDVYRPIGEILQEIRDETPEVIHPCVFSHPVTGESILYISEGFTQDIYDSNGNRMEESFLNDLLFYSGQLDPSFSGRHLHLQTFEKGDLLIWDNRSLVHCALHTTAPEPTESFRITLHDQHEFYRGAASKDQSKLPELA